MGVGKNDNTPAWELSDEDPFDHWANGYEFAFFKSFYSCNLNHGISVPNEDRD